MSKCYVLLLLLAVGCSKHKSSDDPASNTRNFFGTDDRQLADVNQAPYRSIGRIDLGCTGALIGTNLVLTAAHCIVDQNGQVQSKLGYFQPAFANGVAPAQAWMVEAWVGGMSPEKDRLTDWAIVRIGAPLGSQYGTIAISAQTINATQLPYKVTLSGYSGDYSEGKSQSVHHDCLIHERLEDRLLNDCDATAGISGAPVLSFASGHAEIVALAVSEYRQGAQTSIHPDVYSRETSNVSIGSERFASVAATLLQSDTNGNFPTTIQGATYVKNPNPDPNPSGTPGGSIPGTPAGTPNPGGGTPNPGPGGTPNPGPGGTPGGSTPGTPVVTPGGTPNPNGTPGGTPNGGPVGNPSGTPGGTPNGGPVGNPSGVPIGNPSGYPGTPPAGTPGGIFGVVPNPRSCLVNGINGATVYREGELLPAPVLAGRLTELYNDAATMNIWSAQLVPYYQSQQRLREYGLALGIQNGAARLQQIVTMANVNGLPSSAIYDAYAMMCGSTFDLSQLAQINRGPDIGIVDLLRNSVLMFEGLSFR